MRPCSYKLQAIKGITAMIIDYHTHTFPDKLAPRAVSTLMKNAHAAAFTDGTDSALVASMEKNGIDASVILSVATDPGQVRSINDSVLRKKEERAKRGLIAYGAMHPDYEDWESELLTLKEHSIPGIKLHPVYQGTDLDDIRLLRIYDRCAELGLAVVLHGGYDIGFPGVDRCSPRMSLHALKELKTGSGTHKGFRFVLAHMGGWRQWEEVLKLAPEMLEAGPVFLDASFSLGHFKPLDDGYWKEGDSAMLEDELFVRIVRAYGPERILFGSDSPWSDQGETLRLLKALPLTPEELRTILEGEPGSR